MVGELLEEGRVLHELLTDHMRPQWRQRPLEILIVDNASLDARAADHAGCDCMYTFRGALENIYGTMLGLLSTPTFFPAIGEVKNEVRPQNLPGGRFPPVPLLRNLSDADRRRRLFLPNDQTRVTLARILAGLALEFLIFHEIGHIVGGHLELPRNSRRLSTIAETQYAINTPDDSVLQHVLECDADAFACDVTFSLHTHEKTAVRMRDLVKAAEWQSKDFALLTYLLTLRSVMQLLRDGQAASSRQITASGNLGKL